LLELLKATKNPDQIITEAASLACVSTTNNNKLRRSLSGDFNQKDDCSPAKKVKVELHHQAQLSAAQLILSSQLTSTNAPIPQIPNQEIPLTALKPLLSYSDNQNPNQLKKIAVASVQANQRPIPMTNTQNLLASLVASKPVKTVTVDNSKPCRPLLLSSLSKTNGGVFQIIPIQCKPLKGIRDKPIHAVPVVLGQQAQTQNGQQQHCVTAMSPVSNNVLTMLMRPPVVSATSPASVLLSPRNPVLKKPNAELFTGQQIMEKYPEYFTPPHSLFQNPSGKPAANPIIFPKMTPETPSSNPKGALNAVTRKLMSFQNEEEQK
jgi:hypothetical protein